MKGRFMLLLVAGAASIGAANAQQTLTDSATRLINMDTPLVPASGAVGLRAEFRAFGGDEKQGYGTAQVDAGLGQGLGLVLRSTFSPFSTFHGAGFAVRHGGSDLEALLKFSPMSGRNFAVLAGVALPNTPAQKNLFGSAEAVYGFHLQQINLYLGAKTVLRQHSDLAAAELGVDFALAPQFRLIADADFPFTGENTYSTSTGALQRDGVYGAALRYTNAPGRPQYSVDLGVTNGLGGTMGFSMTPTLGSSIGFYLAASYRY